MSQGEIRKGRENSNTIPLESPVWFVVLSTEKGKIKERVFNTSKTKKKELLTFLVLGDYRKVYGVWNGQWNTHLFDMDIKVLKERLERDVGITETDIKIGIKDLVKEFSRTFSLEELAETRGISCKKLKKLMNGL